MLSSMSQYKFTFNKYNGKYKVKLFTDSSVNWNLCGLFNSLETSDIPSFLYDTMLKNSRSSRDGGFLKGPVFEERPNEKDLDIKENQIQITYGENPYLQPQIMELELFYELSIKYAHKCLELVTWYELLEKGIVDKNWIEEVKQWIINFERNNNEV
jgi:hypothetical protein